MIQVGAGGVSARMRMHALACACMYSMRHSRHACVRPCMSPCMHAYMHALHARACNMHAARWAAMRAHAAHT